MKDDLGQRMKENYENRTRFFLPRRTYTIFENGVVIERNYWDSIMAWKFTQDKDRLLHLIPKYE